MFFNGMKYVFFIFFFCSSLVVSVLLRIFG